VRTRPVGEVRESARDSQLQENSEFLPLHINIIFELPDLYLSPGKYIGSMPRRDSLEKSFSQETCTAKLGRERAFAKLGASKLICQDCTPRHRIKDQSICVGRRILISPFPGSILAPQPSFSKLIE
jgi:hypothetical protein